MKFSLPTTSFKHEQILPTSSCVCHRNHPNNGSKQSSPQQLVTSSRLNTWFIFTPRLESPCCSTVSESLATDYNQFRIWLLLSIGKWTWNNRKPYLRKLTQVTLLNTWILTLYRQKTSLTKSYELDKNLERVSHTERWFKKKKVFTFLEKQILLFCFTQLFK